MNLIAQNPYRVLGVFANDSAKVRTANIARIRAFSKVGKECAFENDFTEIFGPIDRSENAIEKAISQLSSTDEIPVYTALWLHRTSTLEIGATDISDILRSQLKAKESLDAAYNVMVCSLWEEHKDVYVEYTLKIFEKDKNLTEQAQIQILKYGEEHSTEWRNKELSIWPFYEKVCNTGSVAPKVTKLVRNAYHDFAIDEAIEMAKAISEYKPELFWSLPYWVEKNMQNIVSIARSANPSDDGEIEASTQLTLTQLGNAILIAGKEFVSVGTMWNVKDGENLLSSLRNAFSLIYDSKTKEECSEFCKKVESQIKYLAPSKVIKQARIIRKAIQDFCTKPEEARFAIQLIKDCVAPLIDIKEILGENDLYYRRISTQIADNAIYSADADLSAAEQNYHNPLNDEQFVTTHLHAIIRQCRILACDIELYDIEEDFLKGKFSTYKKRVMRLAEKYGLDDENILPDITMTSEADEFASCGEDYNALREYVRTHPDNKFYELAVGKIRAIEDAAWPTTITTRNLFEYKRKFPDSHNEKKILDALDKLLLGATNGAIADYRTMLQLFPEHPQISEIRNRIEFLIYSQCSTVTGYQEYLDAFPNGKYVSQAKNRIKEIKKEEVLQLFAKCETIEEYNRFILQHPTSELYAKAYLRIEDLRWEQAQRSGDIDSYIKQYPTGRYLQEATKIIAIRQVQARLTKENDHFKACKSTAEFKAYIKEYPDGRYIDIANAVIKRRNRKLYIGILITILFISEIAAWIIIASSSFFSNITSKANTQIVNETSSTDNSDYNLEDENMTASGYTEPESFAETVTDYDQNNPDEEWKDNRLSTGSRPYKEHFGRPLSGSNEFRFKTSSGCDYVILIKRSKDDRYVDHKYVRGGDSLTILVPDGTYNVFLYTGNGWNPNKRVGACIGGFVSGGSFQKDGPVSVTTTIDGDYYYNQICEYTLYPVHNGNLHLKSSNQDEAFN